MNSPLRTTCLFVMASFAFQVLVVSLCAQTQATTTVAPPQNPAQRIPQTVISNGNKYRIEIQTLEKTESEVFSEFIKDIGSEDLQFKAETEQGKDPVIGRRNYSKLMGIREDEEQDMRNIFLRAFYQMKEHDAQCQNLMRELNHSYKADLKVKTDLKAQIDAMDKERPSIYEEAIVKVKQVLGAETFNKVDLYVSQLEGKTDTVRKVTYVGPAGQPQQKDKSDINTNTVVHP